MFNPLPFDLTGKALFQRGMSFDRQTWTFCIRDEEENSVEIEIKRFIDFGCASGRWTYYLVVPVHWLKNPKDWLPIYDGDLPMWERWNYSKSKFNECDFHGGITYCRTFMDNGIEFVKVGCDYGHYGDPFTMDTDAQKVMHNAFQSARDFLAFKPIKPRKELHEWTQNFNGK